VIAGVSICLELFASSSDGTDTFGLALMILRSPVSLPLQPYFLYQISHALIALVRKPAQLLRA